MQSFILDKVTINASVLRKPYELNLLTNVYRERILLHQSFTINTLFFKYKWYAKTLSIRLFYQ